MKIHSTNNKIPCNSTRFFFDKINGKQFHAKFSGCDDFSVRIQIRKNEDVDWLWVAYRLLQTDWMKTFQTKGMSCGNKTQLVSSFRVKKVGDHSMCVKISPELKKGVLKAKRLGKKIVTHDWPKKCLLRK